MLIEPKGQWEHNAYQSDTQFVLEVKPVVADPARAAAQRGRYTGERLSLNFQNVEVRAVLNQISDLEQTRTESFQMNYQKAADVQKLLSDPAQRILSKRGSAVVDARTNTLFVQDVPSRLEEVRRLIAKIDVAVRQVMIEARIVEANDAFSKNLGVRLGWGDNRGLIGGPVGSRIPGTDS